MARCEDFPCCGHESGCCPDFDEGGNQLNMRCTCGAIVPIDSRYSLCDSCLNNPEDDCYDRHDDYMDDQEARDYENSLEGMFDEYGDGGGVYWE